MSTLSLTYSQQKRKAKMGKGRNLFVSIRNRHLLLPTADFKRNRTE
jgi:hypothetical protein